MSRVGYTEGVEGLDKLIHNCEFENQQYVRLIEHESNLIQVLEIEIQTKTEETKQLQSEITQMDSDTKYYHRQFTINRDNSDSLKKTHQVLTEHSAVVAAKLENLRIKRKNEKLDYDQTIKHYDNIWQRYQEKYGSFPLAKELKLCREKEEALKESNQKKRERIAILKRKILDIESKNQYQQMGTKTFIIQLAEMYVTKEKLQREIQLKQEELAQLASSVKTQADSDLNVQKMTQIQITDGDEEMEGQVNPDIPTTEHHSPMISEVDEEEVMQTDTVTVGEPGIDPELPVNQQIEGLQEMQQESQQHNHQPLGFCQQPQQRDSVEYVQNHSAGYSNAQQQQQQQQYHQQQHQQQQSSWQQQMPGQERQPPSTSNGIQRLEPPQMSIPRPQNYTALGTPSHPQPRGSVVRPEPQTRLLMQVPRLQVPSVARPRIGEVTSVMKQLPQQHLPKSAQSKLLQQKSPRSSNALVPNQQLPRSSQSQLSQQHLPKPSQAQIPHQQIPRSSQAQLPKQQLPRSTLSSATALLPRQQTTESPQAQLSKQQLPRSSPAQMPLQQQIPKKVSQQMSSPLQLPQGFRQKLSTQTSIVTTKPPASPLLLTNLPRNQEMPKRQVPALTRPPTPLLSSQTRLPRPCLPSPQVSQYTVQAVTKPSMAAPTRQPSPRPGWQMQAPQTGNSASFNSPQPRQGTHQKSPSGASLSAKSTPSPTSLTADPSRVSPSTCSPNKVPNGPEARKSLLGLGETYYLPLKDGNTNKSGPLTPEHGTRMETETSTSPFDLEKHKKRLESLSTSPGYPGFSADRRMFSEQTGSFGGPGSNMKQTVGSGGDNASSMLEPGADSSESDMFTLFGAGITDSFSPSRAGGMMFNFGGGDGSPAPENNSFSPSRAGGMMFNFCGGDGSPAPENTNDAQSSSDMMFNFGCTETPSSNTDGGNIFSLFGTPAGQEKQSNTTGDGFSFNFGSSIDNVASPDGGALSMFGDNPGNDADDTDASSGFTFSFDKSSTSDNTMPAFKLF